MELTVRPAQFGDAQRIWEIRNEPASLAVAANPEIIPLTKHVAWFNDKYSTNKGNVCFVAEADQNVIGYCRFDLNPDRNQYLNSIAIASAMHGKGIGTFLLQESIKQLKSNIPILAEVRKFNIASKKIFEKVGFKKVSENDQNIYYQY